MRNVSPASTSSIVSLCIARPAPVSCSTISGAGYGCMSTWPLAAPQRISTCGRVLDTWLSAPITRLICSWAMGQDFSGSTRFVTWHGFQQRGVVESSSVAQQLPHDGPLPLQLCRVLHMLELASPTHAEDRARHSSAQRGSLMHLDNLHAR